MTARTFARLFNRGLAQCLTAQAAFPRSSAVSGATFSFASTKEMREEPEQPVKLPHLHNLGSPAYLELSGTMVGRAGLHLWRGSRF